MDQIKSGRLRPAVDSRPDHSLGDATAEITMVEFGSYACPHCRLANEHIASVRDELGDRLRYVFRHRPIAGSDLARRAAVLAEQALDEQEFWKAHMTLMTRSATLTEEDLAFVSHEMGLQGRADTEAELLRHNANERVDADIHSAGLSGVRFTPTFFINGRRYDGPWDKSSILDAMAGRLGHRVRAAAADFAAWGPSAGILLLIAAVAAVIITNTPLGPSFLALWEKDIAISFGTIEFGMSLGHWVNDGLLTVFFLVVGLEIKRELTVGHLVHRRAAALPIAAAVGGMVLPAFLYWLIVPAGALSKAWGIPMATDTAFAIAIIVMMGRLVPIELRIFLTAAAIIDDIGAIAVVTIFYASDTNVAFMFASGLVIVGLILLNRSAVYSWPPYLLLGGVLWFCVYSAGLHATLAGIILAFCIPTRPPPNLQALVTQANAIITAEARHEGEILRRGPSAPALRSLEEIYERLESPADRLLRRAGARSSYVILPIFALANAGVTISPDVFRDHETLMLAIIAGLVVGKPLGFVIASYLAVRLKIAGQPTGFTWPQLGGAGALAGMGFTMSLFIAGLSLPTRAEFDAAKIAIIAASILSALIGIVLLWRAGRKPRADDEAAAGVDHTQVV